MDTRKNEWAKLIFIEPTKILTSLQNIEELTGQSLADEKENALRTNEHRRHREGWETAIFCHGMSGILGRPIYFAPHEDSDYDAITMYENIDTTIYCPIQLKELVPEELNPHADINEELSKLIKYVSSTDTTFVYHINRVFELNLSNLVIPNLNIAALWFFGALTPDKSKWFLAGDLLNHPRIYTFDYPEPLND